MTALVDTNLLVALAVESHKFHADAGSLFAFTSDFVIAAHSLAELYNTLTRPAMYDWPAAEALRLVEQLSARFDVRTLTASQYLGGLARFAALGGVGPRVYDFMIGQVAVVHRIDTIVTSNVRDFAPLFPLLKIITPSAFLETF